MDKRYDIIYAGEVLPGKDPADVRERLAKLFKADAATLDLLFSGREQSIKRNCDEQLARRYKSGMEQAGAKPIVRLSQAADTAATAPPPAPARPTAPPAPAAAKGSMADRVAALVGQPEAAPPPAPKAEPAVDTSGIDLAPAGTPVLKDNERDQTPPANVDTSALQLSEPGPLPAGASPEPVQVDTAHLEVAPAGENLSPPAQHVAPPVPATDGIALAPEGTDFSDCAPAPVPSLELDLHELVLAETGEPMLEDRYRKDDAPAPPDTSHLSVSS